MTTVYPGAHTDRIETLERLVAEQDRRIRDLEIALLSAAGQALVGSSLCDATIIDSASLLCGLAPHVATSTSAADTGQAATISQGTTAEAPTVHPLPVATSSEPLMAEERYSASLGTVTWADGTPVKETPTSTGYTAPPFFRPGDRCAVYTGGDPCVKPGTVEAMESDGRWLVQLDRAGKIRCCEEDLVFLPGSWR